jgi:glutamate/tyrosine decarboxylase-like PLP-dependent enzyme
MLPKNQEKLLNDIHSRVIEYLNDINIKPNKTEKEIRSNIDLSIGTSSDLNQIKTLFDKYLEHSTKTNSPQFYNQLFSGFSTTGYIGELLSTITNNSMYTYEMSPVATLIEVELLNKMSSLIGYKNGGGTFVPGGSNGNFLAMLAARHYRMPTVMNSGLFGVSPMTVFVSRDCHYSMTKSANQLGIGTDNIIKVDVDKGGKMIPDALDQAIQLSLNLGSIPFFVAATAGTTVRGCFDPTQEIAQICKKYNLWFHIDASWGGSVLLSKKHKHLMNGCDQSDSVTWCTHKAMAQPLMCTAILFKDPSILESLNDVAGTEYLFHNKDSKEPDLGKQSLQCGRRVDVLKLWFTWKYYGDSEYGKKIDHLFNMAKYAELAVIKSKMLNLVSDVNYLNICFQIQPDGINTSQVGHFTIAVRNELFKNADAMVNYAEIDGKTCMRLVTVNYDLNTKHIDQLFSDIESNANKLLTNYN